jgi:hypothetical protein
VRAAIAADPRAAHVARPRGKGTAFSNGGTELDLAHESAVRHVKDVHAVVVFDARAFGAGKDTRLVITCATPVSLTELARLGLGHDHLGAVRIEAGHVVATVERVYANRVLETRDEVPRAAVARDAIGALFARGSVFKEALAPARARLAMRALAAKLAARGHPAGVAARAPVPSFEEWLAHRLVELGVESGDDLALLSAADFLPDDVPFEAKDALEREFPLVVDVGDATFEAEYDLDRGQVLLRMVKGSRKGPPPLAYLPRFAGLRICVIGPRGTSVLRERG